MADEVVLKRPRKTQISRYFEVQIARVLVTVAAIQMALYFLWNYTIRRFSCWLLHTTQCTYVCDRVVFVLQLQRDNLLICKLKSAANIWS